MTAANPARPGEIVHVYGTGFGRVDSPPPTGMPAPSDPPARTIVPVTCWTWGADNVSQLTIPVLFSGLAPGLVSYYQLDMQLPASNIRTAFQFYCKGEDTGEPYTGQLYNSRLFGSFWVKP